MHMKLSVGKRILMFLHWLVSLLICAAFATYIIAPDFIMKYYAMVETAVSVKYVKIIGIALLVLYAALAIVQIYLIFKRKKRAERGFITVDSSDTGRVRIAVSAIEQMVRQSVTSIDGITEMKINIDNQDDAIVIGVVATIVNGSHVPTITMNMQRAIRQFVEMNCGVAVREVSISINAVTNSASVPKRRKLGRGKGKGEALAPVLYETNAPQTQIAPQPQTAAETQAATEPAWSAAGEEIESTTPEATFEPAAIETAANEPAPETPTFDFDKPYESEFAKDLAAMKAAEAAGSEVEEDEAVEDEDDL